MEREREARRITKEYREAQREARRISNELQQAARESRRTPEGTKRCPGCLQVLPIDAFSVNKRGHRQSRCKPCANAYARAAYYRKLGRPDRGTSRGSIDPVKRREAAERIEYLASLLKGLDPNQRLTSVEEWDVTTTELKKLWHLSGDKECGSCGGIVPSTAMRPPGPGNFYTGKCSGCATAERHADELRVFGKITTEPPKIHLRDGTSITVADFARRVGERRPIYERSNRFPNDEPTNSPAL
jgi:hypothetical protein